MAIHGGETSLKQLIQRMSGNSVETVVATVQSADPLKIVVDGDENIVLNDRVASPDKFFSTWQRKNLKMKGTIKLTGGPAAGTYQFEIENCEEEFDNSLKEGEKVRLIAYQGKDKYVIDDRIGDQ